MMISLCLDILLAFLLNPILSKSFFYSCLYASSAEIKLGFLALLLVSLIPSFFPMIEELIIDVLVSDS